MLMKTYKFEFSTLTVVRRWRNAVRACVRAGCQVDLERKVPTQEAAGWAASNGVLFVETSAKTGQGVEEVFQKIGAFFFNKRGAWRRRCCCVRFRRSLLSWRACAVPCCAVM